MKKELKNLHPFAPLCHECFRKVVEGKEKGVKPLSLTPCILINNKDQKIIRESFPQTRTLTGLSYTPLLFYGCKGKYFSLYSKAFTIKIQRFEDFLFAYLLINLNITHLRE